MGVGPSENDDGINATVPSFEEMLGRGRIIGEGVGVIARLPLDPTDGLIIELSLVDNFNQTQISFLMPG